MRSLYIQFLISTTPLKERGKSFTMETKVFSSLRDFLNFFFLFFPSNAIYSSCGFTMCFLLMYALSPKVHYFFRFHFLLKKKMLKKLSSKHGQAALLCIFQHIPLIENEILLILSTVFRKSHGPLLIS